MFERTLPMFTYKRLHYPGNFYIHFTIRRQYAKIFASEKGRVTTEM